MRFFTFAVLFLALFTDGATDCANSVTGAVSSGILSEKKACLLCSVCSFFGCLVCCTLLPFVADTTARAVTFPDGCASVAVLSSLLGTTLWSLTAWLFSLPTSEGHGLISASAGAAAALGGTVDRAGLLRVLISAFPVALTALLFSAFFTLVIKKDTRLCAHPLIIAQSVLSSFFHGAQDGQKFLALGVSAALIPGASHLPTVLLCAISMAIGSLFGRRIIKKMGGEMARCDERGALCADLGSTLCLGLCTALGIPASTTHVKMCSLTLASRLCEGRTDLRSFLLLVAAWCATFPLCFFVTFLLSKAFSAIIL